jgi:hypothetical protein
MTGTEARMMKRRAQTTWRWTTICVGSLVCIVHVANGIEGDTTAPATIPRAVWISNQVAKTKEAFHFQERERQRPRYDTLVTNWCPAISVCEGITNVAAIGRTTSEEGETRSYQGREGKRFVSVTIHYMQSSRAAHELLMKSLALSPAHSPGQGARDVIDENERIGDRQIDLPQDEPTLNSLVFIRNNVYVSVTGFGVRIVNLARELDRQILLQCRATEDKNHRH